VGGEHGRGGKESGDIFAPLNTKTHSVIGRENTRSGKNKPSLGRKVVRGKKRGKTEGTVYSVPPFN